MAWQLIFTSTAAGLQPGSFGYCTVARSAAMRDAVASRLEQWSVYTHATRGVQPVICAHRILTLGRTNYHVLSRLADSGLDYTGRTNFLAHHLVLQDFELGEAASPAALLAHWTGWCPQWTGEPRLLTAEEDVLNLQVAVSPGLPARTWAATAGDAGGAAWLVNEMGTAARQASLVVPPGWEGEQLLSLYAESLCLLDPKRAGTAAWSVAFTTYLQPEDDAADFQWRGVWEEYRVQAVGGEVLDFVASRFPALPSNTGVLSLARSGMKLEVRAPNAVSSTQAAATPNFGEIAVPQRTTTARPKRASVVPKSNPWYLIGASLALFCLVFVGFTLFWRSRESAPQRPAQSQPEAVVQPPLATPVPIEQPFVSATPGIVVVAPTPAPTVDPAEAIRTQAKARLDKVEAELTKKSRTGPRILTSRIQNI